MQVWNAKFIIDASGFGRVLPRLMGLGRPLGDEPKSSIFSHFHDTHRPEGDDGTQGTFVVHKKDVWTWIIPFADGRASVGFVGNPEYIRSFDEEDKAHQLLNMIQDVPYLANRFKGQKPIRPTQMIHAYAVTSTEMVGPGYVIAGHSSEFLDPVFSSGVTFATESGLKAGKLASRQLSGEDVDWQTEYVQHMKQGLNTFKTYVDSWYEGTLQDMFFYSNNNFNAGIKQKICSVLAGYVWDMTNPYVSDKRERALESINRLMRIY